MVAMAMVMLIMEEGKVMVIRVVAMAARTLDLDPGHHIDTKDERHRLA